MHRRKIISYYCSYGCDVDDDDDGSGDDDDDDDNGDVESYDSEDGQDWQ